MQHLITDYRNQTADHCGSGAMRNLLYHYCKLDLPEGAVFGLGSGLDCIYFNYPAATPGMMLFGRSISMEQDLAANLGLDYTELLPADDDSAWQDVKAEVLAGKPTMLSGDIFYLDYRQFKVHFPSHRFVLLGFDEAKQEVYVADRTDVETQTCSMQALRLSRNPPVGISTFNLWGKFSSGQVKHSMPQACELALNKTIARMRGDDVTQAAALAGLAAGGANNVTGGLAGIAALAQAIPGWHQYDDAAARAEYVYNAIVKFGTGGALFRNLYAAFLRWAHATCPHRVNTDAVILGERTAAQWSALAPLMQELQQQADNTALWQQAGEQVRRIAETETALFDNLADNSHS